MDQVKSIITLRSGKIIEKPILEPCEKDDELISKGKEGVESKHCKEKTDSSPVLPFPHAMTKQRKINHNSEIFETTGPSCSRTHMHFVLLVKIVKKLILVKKFCFIILNSVYFLQS